jgi:hypothetical protein
MFLVSMPNFATSSAFVETATKCLATAASSFSAARHHARAARALVSVSSVVKVFEQMTKRVSRGSRSRVLSTKSVPSTLDTNRKLSPRALWCFSAS